MEPSEPRAASVPAAPAGNGIEARLAVERLRYIYQQLPLSLYTALAIAAGLVIVLWSQISHALLLTWAIVLVSVSAGRLCLHAAYRRARPGPDDGQRWRTYFVAGAALGGAVWGAAGCLLMPADSIVHRILVIFVLGGLLIGASQSLSAVQQAFVVFAVPMLLPAVVWLAGQGTAIDTSMAVMLLIFLVAVILMARRFNRTLGGSLRLGFENADLVDTLTSEVAQREQSEQALREHSTILENLAGGESLSVTLRHVNDLIETRIPGVISSILMLDEAATHLRTASAPNLPGEYSAGIDGLAIGPSAGSCGTAAYRNEVVIVDDIAADPLWTDYRELALAHGLKACWSMPIRDSRNAVLGTFALYHREPSRPREADVVLLQSTAQLAGIAIEHKRHEARLRHLAHTDQLTSLPNRALFMDRLSQALARARRYERELALLFIDLDKFKSINDTLGHEAGDEALRTAARRMLNCVRVVDTVARFGGDEFAVILPDITHGRDAAIVARKIQCALSRPIELQGEQYDLGCSIGISLYPADGEDVDVLLRMADAAMYSAKQQAGSKFHFYNRAL